MLSQRNKTKKIDSTILLRYKNAVSYIEAFSNRSISFKQDIKKTDKNIFIKRTDYMLSLVGNPEKTFKYVHITGTAGKGSTANHIHNSLVADSRKSGLFTTPYVTVAIEQIKVGDYFISPKEFIDIVDSIKPVVEKTALLSGFGRPTSFELFFVIALIYFKKQKCEWVVAEVGVGGRFDPTNMIPNPLVTVITNVDFDHTNILGKELNKIAYDKAGIIKNGSNFFTSEKRVKILNFFRKECQKQKATFNFVKQNKKDTSSNITLAREVVMSLGISDTTFEKSLNLTKLPCRFEIMKKNPLIVLDGAHDRIKMKHTVSKLKELKYKRLFLIVGTSGITQDNNKIFPIIVPLVNNIVVTTMISYKRQLANPKIITPFVKKYKKSQARFSVIYNPQEALEFVIKKATKEDCILVTGSFFLAGELRKKWFSEKFVLEHRKSFA